MPNDSIKYSGLFVRQNYNAFFHVEYTGNVDSFILELRATGLFSEIYDYSNDTASIIGCSDPSLTVNDPFNPGLTLIPPELPSYKAPLPHTVHTANTRFIKTFPNPYTQLLSAEVYVSEADAEQGAVLEVYDAMGMRSSSIPLKSGYQTLDLSREASMWSRGVQVLVLRSGSKIKASHKIVKTQ